MIKRKKWSYGEDVVDRDYLKSNQSFFDLISDIETSMKDIQISDVRFQVEPKNGRYTRSDSLLKKLECFRPSWHISLDSELLDKLYNGLMGIRAQYYISPYHGNIMNHILLKAITGILIDIATSISLSVNTNDLKLSLSYSSAKIWVSESDLNGNKIIRASDLKFTENEIQNDWLDVARDTKEGMYNDNYQLFSASLNGIRAPIPDQIEIKGAWLTKDDKLEYVPNDKKDRDCQLFMFGYT